jgi:preprotein translocase subunit YajC
MSLLISDAFAATATSQGDSMYSMMMVAVIFVLFYFMLIRPQNQRLKTQRAMVSTLKKGDEVVIGAGIIGKINHLDEQYIKLSIAEGCEITVQRQSVTTVLPKGTLKAI